MFAKLHLLSQDVPEGGGGLRWRAHPYLRMVGAVPRGPAVFAWSARQREDLEALWRDPTAEGARARLAQDLAAFCDQLGWAPDAALLADAELRGDEYLVTISAVPPELYVLPWEVIQVGASGSYLSDYASAQVRYAVPGLEPREILGAPPAPGVLFAWSEAGGAVPHDDQATAIRAAAEAGGVRFDELAGVDEAGLQAALDAGPPSVLHLLCHGQPGSEGEPPRLTWGAGDQPSDLTATQLARMLRRHHGAIRLVVLSACSSGDGRGDPLYLNSLAQELHRKGIPNVVASRYPLSVAGARVMTRALYDKLLREAWSLERALRHTREALLRVDAGGDSHAGDAYGIQLYAYDTERFVSDNQVVAERPVLASYPFGTPARPVPASGPPAAELTLQLDADPVLDHGALTEPLRRVSEDGELTVATAAGARALIVRTTVDGAQRLLGAWRSKVLQAAVGVILGELVMTKGILPAMAGTSSTAGGAGEAARSTGQQAASTSHAAAPGQAGATAGQAATATAASTAKAAVAVAVKVVAAKVAVAAVIGGAALVGGGVAVYRATTTPAPAAMVAPAPPASASPSLSPPAIAVAEPAAAPPVDAGVAAVAVAAPRGPERGASSAAQARSAATNLPVAPPPVMPRGAPPDAAVPDALPAAAVSPPPSVAALADAGAPDALPVAAPATPPAVVTSPSHVLIGPALVEGSFALRLKRGAPPTIFRSRNYAQPGSGKAVAFVVPHQANASGPEAMVATGAQRDATLTVLARTAARDPLQPITLHGFRSSGCGRTPMNDAMLCKAGSHKDARDESVLGLTVLEADNAAVPSGVYTGSVMIEARGWQDKAFVEDLDLSYQITIEHGAAAMGAGSAVPDHRAH